MPINDHHSEKLVISRIICNYYNIFVRRYGCVAKFEHKKGDHLDSLLGDYENEKSYLGLIIV